jgi:hypothetical protein
MCGEERRAMRAAIWGLSIGGVFILLGSWTQNITWLAIATCAAIIFMRVVSWVAVWKSLGFSADALTSLRKKLTNLRA